MISLSTADAEAGAIPALDHELSFRLERCGAALRGAGFEPDSVTDLLGLDRGAVAGVGTSVVPRRRVRAAAAAGEPLAAIVELLLLGEPAEEEAARRCLPDTCADTLLDAGVLERSGGDLRASAAVIPWRELLLACDPWAAAASGDGIDHAPPVTRSTQTVWSMMPRGETGTVLDVGAGCGALAMTAAMDARTVVATDVNRRALRHALVGASLSGRPRMEAVVGSLLEPVAGRTFDRIVSNPPYAIAPRSTTSYAFGGMPRDSLGRELVRGASRLLSPDGTSTIMCNWAHDGADPLAPIAAWTADLGCDVLVLDFGTLDAFEYAAFWNQSEDGSPAGDAAVVDEWLAHLDAEGIEHIAGGVIVVRRRGADQASGWLGHVPLGAPVADRFGRDLLPTLLDAHSLLSDPSLDARSLLERPLQLAHGATVVQSSASPAGGGALEPVAAHVVLPSCGGVRLDIDEVGLFVVQALAAGRPTGAEHAALIAEHTGADIDAAATAVVGVLRALLGHGLARP